ncbi:glycosyltransferase family 9 protein [Chitinolyticbacter meiyuanensis]|uniref:glycosyltransferase family 9 protein n=1 Tax=Chitinolyticbacter meiyuanensis TaxID=682798 RepID=UPI0011E5ED67|nr:glycosyltransferase family 9 protein [Chitinolyticbacter meiyuanensis]
MNILLIRRDNIGDLVCSTPLIVAIRARYPQARITVLANSYNAGVLAGNPAIDAVYAYEKAKHREPRQSRWGVYWRTLRLVLALRRQRFDWAIAVGSGLHVHAIKFARWVGARQIVAFVAQGQPVPPGVTHPIDYVRTPVHETLDCFRLLAPLGIDGEPGPLRVYPDPGRLAAMQERLPSKGRVLALHVSAREADRRWPEAHFVALITTLAQRHPDLTMLLLWSPGAESDPRHPGDDALAGRLLAASAGWLLPAPTGELAELIAALACADLVLCSDGGALHLAAALGKPIVALFENREDKTARWYPWQVPYRMVMPPTRAIRDIPLEPVLAAVEDLLQTLPESPDHDD